MAQHRIINGRGGTGHLATLVERMTRFTLVARVAPKESGCVMPDFLVVCPIRDKAFAGDSAVLTVACCFEPIYGRRGEPIGQHVRREAPLPPAQYAWAEADGAAAMAVKSVLIV